MPKHVTQAHLGNQYASFFSSRGAPALLPQQLSASEHLSASADLVHPFLRPAQLPLDLHYAAETVASSGSGIIDMRADRMQAMHQMADLCHPLTAMVHEIMHEDARGAAAGINIALLLVLIVLLHWPDWSFPDRFVSGFRTVGAVDASNLFTPIDPRNMYDIDDFGEDENDSWNSGLVDMPPADIDDIIWQTTEKDRSKGQVTKYLTKAEMDACYGRGRWRAIPRRTIWQRNAGKWRNVDNCKKSLHNAFTALLETIFTAAPDTGEQVVILYRQVLRSEEHTSELQSPA